MKGRMTTGRGAWIAAILSFLFLCAPASAQVFFFQIPKVPNPPVIEDVLMEGIIDTSTAVTVTAKIYGQKQQQPACDFPDKEDCALSDWYMVDEEGVTPNPPEIKSAKVFYYKNDAAQSPQSAVMSLAPELGENVWKADAPLSALAPLAEGDTFTFYIVAIDSRGNVSSQVPDTGISSSTCPSSPSGWNPEYSTPATNSCTYATSYNQCGVNQAGAPSPCYTTYTVADKAGDVCGEPVGGVQNLITMPKQDLLGITAAADANYLCVNMGLGAPPPDPTDAPPIEGYFLTIYNPDVYDDNPADPWIKNAYVMTFMPEIVGSDPSLVRVLWEGDCLSDPGTANPLDCKLISVTGTDSKLQMGYNSGMKFIVKKSGTGNVHPHAYNLIGAFSKKTYLVGATGEINLAGGTSFWFSDQTPGMGFYHSNNSPIIEPSIPPPPPYITSTTCTSSAGTGVDGVCPQSAAPGVDTCSIGFSPEYPSATGYRIYRVDSSTLPSGITPIATLSTDAQQFSESFSGSELDGRIYYYFIATVDSSAPVGYSESVPPEHLNTKCRLEDFVPPATPTITAAYTPPGTDLSCRFDFSFPAIDYTIVTLRIFRDGVQIAETAAQPGTASFSWTDVELSVGQNYCYTVQAVDRGGNVVTSEERCCTAEDKKAPARPQAPVVSNMPMQIRAEIDWLESAEPDLAGYNVYECDLNNAMIDCRTADSFTKINASLQTETHAEDTYSTEGDRCYYVEACDDCLETGHCPSNGGVANCSGFPPGGADNGVEVKCISVSATCDDFWKPSFPADVSCAPAPGGSEIALTWTKNCTSTSGSATQTFENCSNPTSSDLTGYAIQSGPQGNVPVPPDTPIAVLPQSVTGYVHKGLTNGTEYCYTVYAFDECSNYSDPYVNKHEVCCTAQEPPPGPTDVSVTLAANHRDIEIYWTKSTADNGVDGAYTILRCEDAACAAKLYIIPVLNASMPGVQNISASAPLTIKDEPGGTWWYAVTYQASTDILPLEQLNPTGTAIAGPLDVMMSGCELGVKCAVISSCDDYNAKTGCSPLMQVDTAHKDTSGFIKEAAAGYHIALMSQDGSFIGSATSTDATGNFKLEIDTIKNPVSTSSTYRVVMIVPVDKATLIPADAKVSSGPDRRILLKESTVTEDSAVLKVAMPLLPGAGAADAGNPNCDEYINMKDFNVLKNSFGKSTGQAGYETYADMNGDGTVNMKDFNILKTNFGKNLSAAPPFTEGLCKP